MSVTFSAAASADIPAIADLWHQGWRDAHLGIVPAGLLAHRDRASFLARAKLHLAETRLARSGGAMAGFHMLDGGELNQFYVARSARGTGLAAALIADAERVLAARGVRRAWLACSVGNDRAARFYAKAGWDMVGTEMLGVETLGAAFALEVWRFEKDLGQAGRA